MSGSPLTPRGRVAVRMFCQGLGDCFLVAIRTGETEVDYTAIDCGVIAGTPQGPARVAEAARLLREGCGGRLNRLVLTHQHYDHVSSFIDALSEWEAFERIDGLWFAWTEDPGDDLAKRLASRRKVAEQALTSVVAHASARALGAEAGPRLGALNAVLGFLGHDVAAAAPRGDRTAQAMRNATDLVRRKGGTVQYRHPGDVVTLTDEISFVTLGPPHDEKKIRRADPSHAHPEVYSIGSLAAALGEIGPDSPAAPFDGKNAVSLDGPRTAIVDPALRAMHDAYVQSGSDWRRIDEEWLGVAETLALNLDSDTNNTSLAFALYDREGDHFWLFPADAQVGNWLSWGDQTYALRAGEPETTVDDVLARTRFYKAGHHGSHNATMKDRGLELMSHPELCAMVPVDIDVAHRIKRWTKMPFEPMIARLKERTAGRTVRLDEEPVPPPFEAGPLSPVFNRAGYIDYNPPSG